MINILFQTHRLPFSLLFAIVLLLMSCKGKDLMTMEVDENFIIAAEGGGFAGLEHRYLLLTSGRLYYQRAGNDTLHYLGILDRNQTRQLFNNADVIKGDPDAGSGPGNRYFLLEYSYGSGSMKKVWDPDGVAVPDRWRLLHQVILSFGKEFREKHRS